MRVARAQIPPLIGTRAGRKELFFDLVMNACKPLLSTSSTIMIMAKLRLQLLDPVLGRTELI